LTLYQKILTGLSQIKNGETIPEEEMMKKITYYSIAWKKKKIT